jgi:hypothetical protein
MSTDETHSHCLTRSPEGGANYHARWIGKPIFEALRYAKTVSVRGTTSRGIFLELDNNWIAFLSPESQRGPLTLNMEEKFKGFDLLKPGLVGVISNNNILFDSLNLIIDTNKANVWSNKISEKIENYPNVMATRNFIVVKFINRLAELLFSPNEYLEFSRKRFFKTNPSPSSQVEENLIRLNHAIEAGDATSIEAPLQFIVGRGHGLTPAGDDFLAGILFALHMFKDKIYQIDQSIQKMIIASIYRHSTLISANLAACAAEGEVDERISIAVEYLLMGNGAMEDALSSILGWGSSSGVDMIAGFITGLIIEENHQAI